MSDESQTTEQADPSPVKSARRRWLRYLYQFSLRTLLVAMTAAAIGCWWFLQPDSTDEELAGKQLVLRRQVRTVNAEQSAELGILPDDNGMALVNDGYWRLVDEHGGLLVDGRYAKHQSHGVWTIYHANGRLAVEGTVLRGQRNGLWRAWDEEGQLRSETTYQIRGPRPASRYVSRPIYTSRIETPDLVDAKWSSGPVRHGSARVWHANGQLRAEGEYSEDRRSGLWSYYDASGRLVARGEYYDDRRTGDWTVRDPAGGNEKHVTFVYGLPKAEHARRLARLRADLASDEVRRQVAAVAGLPELGEPGMAALAEAVRSSSDTGRLLALRTLVRHRQPLEALLPAIGPLVDHSSPSLARWAVVATYIHQPARRKELFPRLLKSVAGSHDVDARIEILGLACEVDDERQNQVFAALLKEKTTQQQSVDNGGFYDRPSRIMDFNLDLPRLLAAAMKSPDADVRWGAVAVIDEVVRLGVPAWINNNYTWPIPDNLKTILAAAKLDPDPRVRDHASQIGLQPAVGGCFF